MKQRRIQIFLVIAIAYIGLRLVIFLPSSFQAWPDTGTYLHVAEQSFASEGFWAGWRPWTTPLLYKLLPDSDTARAVGQLVISIACWLALAGAVAWNVCRPAFRPVAFSIVLLFSLSVWVTQWDPVLLSESLAVSLTAAALAAWLALVRVPRGWTVTAVLATSLLLAFTRDSEASLALLALPLVLAWAVRSSWRRESVALAVGLLIIAGASWLAQGSDSARPRRQLPLLNLIGIRVLTDQDQLRYFREHGMPLPVEVMRFAGVPLATNGPSPLGPGEPLTEDPEVAEFISWVGENARETLILYLLTHPYRALEPVVDEAAVLLTPEPDSESYSETLAAARAEGTEPLLPAPLADVVYPPSVAAVLAWLALAAVAAGCLARIGFARAVWLVPVAAVVLQFPHAAIVWNADPTSVTRHALTVSVVTRLGLLVFTVFLIDAAVEWRARQRGSEAIEGVSGAAL